MRRPARNVSLIAAIVACALVGVGAGAGTYALFGGSSTVVRQVTVSSSQPTSDVTSSSAGLTVGQIYTKTNHGVVEITVSSTSDSPLGGGTQQAQGSGFVYDDKGDIVTNQHVVDGAQSISVKFWNGKTYKATLVGSDPSSDLAVVKVDAPASLLEPLSLGDSSKVAVGDDVVAIGSPFGLEGSVTSGIVSALQRDITAPNNFTISNAIQTDAPINHGNSGGPLLNAQGEVVGVNSQIESQSGGSEGVGFAVPSNTVRSVVSQLIGGGQVRYAYLGIQMIPIPANVASQLGIPQGVEVTEVKASTPAAAAGLRAATGTRTIDGQQYPTGGDVITHFDGKRITSANQLEAAVEAKQPGDKATVTYVRDGKTKTVTVTLATRPS
jgi:S1-C subfamily serine protease